LVHAGSDDNEKADRPENWKAKAGAGSSRIKDLFID
jgi:hypothetical protein